MKPAILATAIAALTTLTADAALITWGAAQNITSDSDVSLDGTLLGAVTFGALPSSPTVNGVSFTGILTPGSFGPFSFSGLPIGVNVIPLGIPPHSLLSISTPYRDLLGSWWMGSASVTLNGLVVGDTYLVQFWSDVNGQAFSDNTVLTAGTSVTLDQNNTDFFGGIGQYVLGTFVADATTQAIFFDGRVNAVQLRNLGPASVPEPGTALAGVMLAGLLGVRRRRN